MSDDPFAYLNMEMQMGMRAQSMGRDQDELIWQMRELPQDLVLAYFSTKFVLHIAGAQVVLKIDEDVPPALVALENSWAIMTAYNPYSEELTERGNQALQASLVDMLDLHGYQTLPVLGRSSDGNWEEPSILVLGISYELAKSFGSCFRQNAVVYGEANGPAELVFCDKELPKLEIKAH